MRMLPMFARFRKHGKMKSNCVKCSGCTHGSGRPKKHCIICTPSQACPHKAGRRKTACLLCTPSQRCPHVEKCPECVDLDECDHVLKWKNNCVLCSPHRACEAHPTEHVRTDCPDYKRMMTAKRKAAKAAAAGKGGAGPSSASTTTKDG